MKRIPLERTQLWLTIKCCILGQSDRRWPVLILQVFGQPKSAIICCPENSPPSVNLLKNMAQDGTILDTFFFNEDVASVAD